jgi:hypothetical protein
MSPGMTVAELHQKLSTNIDLYNYICALDQYIDEIEEAIDNIAEVTVDSDHAITLFEKNLKEAFEKRNKVEEFFTATANPPPCVVLMYGDNLEKDHKEEPEKKPYKSKFQSKIEEALAKSEEAKKERQSELNSNNITP